MIATVCVRVPPNVQILFTVRTCGKKGSYFSFVDCRIGRCGHDTQPEKLTKHCWNFWTETKCHRTVSFIRKIVRFFSRSVKIRRQLAIIFKNVIDSSNFYLINHMRHSTSRNCVWAIISAIDKNMSYAVSIDALCLVFSLLPSNEFLMIWDKTVMLKWKKAENLKNIYSFVWKSAIHR